MAKVVTDSKHYFDIAEVLREKNGDSTQYKPSEMPTAVSQLYQKGYDSGHTVGYEKGINRRNLINKAGTVSSSQSGLTVDYNEATQIYTINGTSSGGKTIILSNNMPLDWVVGDEYNFSRHYLSGSITFDGTSYLLWSIFNMKQTDYIKNRITEKSGTLTTPVQTLKNKAVAESNNDGYKLLIQLLGSGNITFTDYKVKFSLVPEEDSILPWIPYIFE